jgi:hypothetical protein
VTTAMLIVGGLFVGGTYSFARQKHYVGAVVLAIAAVLSFVAAWLWSK